MAALRPGQAGKTRNCPHCKAIILETASVCPGCHHHLRFGPMAGQRSVSVRPALRVEGAIRHPGHQEPWEYSVVISIRNERDEEIARHVVGVGALQPSERRTFSLAVDVLAPGKEQVEPADKAAVPPASQTAAARPQTPSPAAPAAASSAREPEPAQPGRPVQPPKPLSPAKPAQSTKRFY